MNITGAFATQSFGNSLFYLLHCSGSLTNVSSYICGLKWRTCKCEQVTEHRLFDRAEEIVDRDEPHMRRAVLGRAQRIEQAVENLRQRHNCDHEGWHTVRGRHDCEVCSDTLLDFINECNRCPLRACNRCRNNRL